MESPLFPEDEAVKMVMVNPQVKSYDKWRIPSLKDLVRSDGRCKACQLTQWQ